VKHKLDNAFTLESSEGEIISMVGCCEEDCDCTTLMMTKTRRGKKKHFAATLPREVLEYMRDSIDAILDFHDSKCLD
jgi:hypothetical protein